MPYLPFIDDVLFQNLVHDLLNKGEDAQKTVAKNLSKNTIDPFAVLFEMASFNLSHDEWRIQEANRQSQKTLSNHIGGFHQEFLGSLKGWKNLKQANILDIVNEEAKICAEIKNKHNTLNAGGLVKLYDDLEKEVMDKNTKYRGYTAYYVQIIPHSPERFNEAFTPSDKGKGIPKALNPRIRKIDGASFYALATGEEDALEQVFKALPKVIAQLRPHFDNKKLEITQRYFAKAFQPSLVQYENLN